MQTKFAGPDINNEPVVCPKLTPLYLSFALNALTITPCAKALNGAVAAASNTHDNKVKFTKFC